MRLKKYEGCDIRSVIDRIRNELGEDALIVESESAIIGGVFGFFGKPGVRVIAAAAEGDERAGLERDDPSIDLALEKELPGAPAGSPGPPVRVGANAPAPVDFVPLHLTIREREARPASEESGLPAKAVFIGPAGSGKTSVMGRLAWEHSRKGQVTVVSIEEEGRLSGVARWREFWESFGVALVTVFDLDGLRRCVESTGGSVLVDTPPLDRRGLPFEPSAISAALPGFAVFLVVDSRTDIAEFSGLVGSAGGVPNAVVFTKVDDLFHPSRLVELGRAVPGTGASLYYTDSPCITDSPLLPVVLERLASAGGER